MHIDLFIKNASQLVTTLIAQSELHENSALGGLLVIEDGALAISDAKIVAIGKT